MRVTFLAAAVLVTTIALAGCGGSGGGSSPEATFRLYKASMSDRNFEDVWTMLSAASKKRMNEDAATISERAAKAEGPGRRAVDDTARLIGMTSEQMASMDGKTFFIALLKMVAEAGREEWEKLPRAEISRVQKDGSRALVFVKVDGREQADRPLPLLNEGGVWKIDLASVKMDLAAPSLSAPMTPSPAAPAAPKEAP